ncbi:hypothetical protein, partial [uncultured Helicobacter sp.]|uniref:hypothetical protein n=1 Tax=uncultured Helicobacter sp. TaxID=175537 RepID=UPI00262D6154
ISFAIFTPYFNSITLSAPHILRTFNLKGKFITSDFAIPKFLCFHSIFNHKGVFRNFYLAATYPRTT